MLLKVIFPRFFIVLLRIPISKLIFLFILLLAFSAPSFFVLGEEQDVSLNLEEICELEEIEKSEKIFSDTDYRELLEKCQEYYEQKSAQIEDDINKTQKEKKTLQNKIWTLRNKISKLENQIFQSNLMIKDIGLQVKDTESSIRKTSLKIEESQEKLVNILRTIYEEDQKSIVETLLSEANLSDFFDNLVALELLGAKNKEFLSHIKDLRAYLETQKESLDSEKQELKNVVVLRSLQKQESAATKREQEGLLGKTEAEYQEYLKEQEQVNRNVAEIRARIFELIGVPEAPTFGEAHEIAKYVETITGVRPALLLAVLTQESNIGKNVGQCYLRNFKTGGGVVAYNGKEISRVMKPDGLPGRKGDIPYFLKITKELDRDPKNTLVSCPMSYGWGGAMGPAQFIPSTWILYREKVKEITGQPADPWNIKDAFLAAGLYLARYKAKNQTYDSEINAVLSYFAGPGWYKSKYKNVYKRDYGYPVMRLAGSYQKDIEALEAAQ